MARTFNPIRTTGALAALAADLRALMQESGLTYRRMAERCDRSQGPLSTAAGGVHLPTWGTVEAYVSACGGNPAAWRARFLAAQQEVSASHNGAGESAVVEIVNGRRPNPPSPFDARSPEDFIDLLHQVRMWAGEPSWRVLAGKMDVPTSTLHSMLHRDKLPPTGLLRRFLRACGVDSDDWMQVRIQLATAQDRARRRPTSRPAPMTRKRA